MQRHSGNIAGNEMRKTIKRVSEAESTRSRLRNRGDNHELDDRD